MKLPEWRPIPKHIREDDSDTRGFFASTWLIGSVLLIAGSMVVLLIGLLLS